MNGTSQHTFAEIGVPDVPLGMLEVERLALLTVAPHGVVLTVITHSPTDVSSSQEDCHVKVARAGMFVAVTFCGTRPMSRIRILNLFTNGGRRCREESSLNRVGSEFEESSNQQEASGDETELGPLR